MRAGFDLPDWNSLAGQEDDTLPLLGTALLIARDEYPRLDADFYDALLQGHAEEMRSEIEAIEPLPLKMQAINRHLFEELGYAGNHDEYYDPRNSYINEVFERRLGNPISLAMVQMEVARRLGMPLVVIDPAGVPTFDIPTIGAATLEAMRDGGAVALAVPAGQVLLLDRERVIHVADAAGIAVVSVDGQP